MLSEHEKIGIESLLGERRDHGEFANLAPLWLDARTFLGLFECGTRPTTLASSISMMLAAMPGLTVGGIGKVTSVGITA